jgi:hypothetical protein
VALLEELDRQDRGQAAENIEVIPFDDVTHRRRDDHASEILRHPDRSRSSHSHLSSSLSSGLSLRATQPVRNACMRKADLFRVDGSAMRPWRLSAHCLRPKVRAGFASYCFIGIFWSNCCVAGARDQRRKTAISERITSFRRGPGAATACRRWCPKSRLLMRQNSDQPGRASVWRGTQNQGLSVLVALQRHEIIAADERATTMISRRSFLKGISAIPWTTDHVIRLWRKTRPARCSVLDPKASC